MVTPLDDGEPGGGPPEQGGGHGHLTMGSGTRALPHGVFTLAAVTFIDPFGLVLAAAVGLRAARAGQRAYDLPADPDVAQYCTRMGLVEVLRGRAGLQPLRPVVPQAVFDRRDVLVELRCVGTRRGESLAVADLVFERLRRNGSAEEAYNCVAEACMNVVEHAGSEGYVAAQVYGRHRAGRTRIVLAVADAGVGVAASLGAQGASGAARAPGEADGPDAPRPQGAQGTLDDELALRRVVEDGFSASGDLGRGVQGMVEVVDDFQGRMVLRSGEAWMVRTEGASTYRKGAYLRGTAVGIELPCR